MTSTWKVSCKASIAGWRIDSADDSRTELIMLDVASSLLSGADSCELTLYAPAPRKKGLLEGVAGAAMEMAAGAVGLGGSGAAKPPSFSIQVRDQAIKHGDQLTVELKAGDRSGKVATVDVYAIESSLGQTRIQGATGKWRLTHTRVNGVYENQWLGQIVQDLASRAQVSTGTIDPGSTYNYVAVHESKNVLTHIRELALREGMDVYFDAENKLNVATFTKSAADHTFTFGIDILDLVAQHHEPPADHVVVYGESPSSNQGSSTWYWFAKDLKPFRGDVGNGSRLVPMGDRAIRTKDAADSQAKAKLGAVRDQASIGRMTMLGNPRVKLADAIEIKSAPNPELNGLFKVASVAHRYSRRHGYVTQIGFTGQGGAQAAGGLLGQALGPLAGAVGL
jgi:hypothetical protein